jgi:hypothetical protein
MPILDRQLVLADAQAITTAAATPTTDYLDTLSIGDHGKGQPMWVVARVNTTCTSGGSATVAASLETDDNSSFSSATTLHSVSAVAVASLVAGYTFFAIRLPIGCERYIRGKFTVATADLTAGKFDFYITHDIDNVPATPLPRANYAVA